MLEIDIEFLKKLFPPPGRVFASIAYCGLLYCYCAIAMGHELVCGGKFGVGRLDMTFLSIREVGGGVWSACISIYVCTLHHCRISDLLLRDVSGSAKHIRVVSPRHIPHQWSPGWYAVVLS